MKGSARADLPETDILPTDIMVYQKSFLVGVAALVSVLFLMYGGLYRLGVVDQSQAFQPWHRGTHSIRRCARMDWDIPHFRKESY